MVPFVTKISPKVLLFVAILLLVANLLLIWQNSRLRTEIERSGPVNAREGDLLPPLEVQDLSGNRTILDFRNSEKKTILLHFKTSCTFCEKQIGFWKELANTIDPDRFIIYAITAESDKDVIRKYLDSNSINNWRVFMIDPGDAKFVRFLSTPMTVVVNDTSTIERSWVGAWRESDYSRMIEFFK